MHHQAIGVMAAGMCAMSLCAQNWSPRVPYWNVPQFTKLPKGMAVDPKMEATLRQLLQNKQKEKPQVCSIPLLSVRIPKDLEKMPVWRPPAGNIDNMPAAKLPAPPCDEEQR